MKTLARDPFKHELIELLALHGQQAGFSISDPSGESQFIEAVRASVRANRANEKLLFGRRTETMFRYVAAALGACDIVKAEDSGPIISGNAAIAIPDCRLFLKEGRQLLVEVKNKHGARFVLSKAYIDKLMAYARMTHCDLRIAVYWSQDNRWSLLDPAQIPQRSGQYSIEAIESMYINEMKMIGDFALVTPTPILVRVEIDRAAPQEFDRATNKFKGKIGGMLIYSEDRLVEDAFERKVATFLLDNGAFEESGWRAVFDGDEVAKLEKTYRMRDEGAADFVFLGPYSSLLSNEFLHLTTSGRRVAAFAPAIDPSELGVAIPSDYSRKSLPITRYAITPNYSLIATGGEPASDML